MRGKCRRIPIMAGFLVMGSIGFGLSGSAARAAACPNEAFREAQGVTALPRCMALEMISPPRKFVQAAYEPSFSLDGGRALFRSQAALAQTPGLHNPVGDRYVAIRGDSGWTTVPTSPPTSAGIMNGAANRGGPYSFSPELDRWQQIGATQAQSVVGIAQVFAGELDGSFFPLSPPMVPIDDSGDSDLQFSIGLIQTSGTSADNSTGVIRVRLPSTGYLPGDPRGNEDDFQAGGDNNSYVVFRRASGEPALELLARDKAGSVYGGRCGAHLGGGAGAFTQGAISPEGSRIYFSARPNQPRTAPCGIATAASTAGSNILTGVTTATGSGALTSGSETVDGVIVSKGEFLVGQTITGTGIPPGTTIVAVTATSLELSAAATVSDVVTLRGGALPFSSGLMISGSGIPEGTKIATVSGQTVTLSVAATQTAGQISVVALQPKRIFKRTQTALGPEIAELIPGDAVAAGDDLYQAASKDGETVYFVSPRKLAASDLDPSSEPCSPEVGKSVGCDLYLYDGTKPVGEQVTQVSVGGAGDPDLGKGADVLPSIVALSGDGSHAYFIAQGILTSEPNPEGDTAVAGEPNLYLFERSATHPVGRTAFIGTLDEGDQGTLWGAKESFIGMASATPINGGSAGGDGHILTFASMAPLTADDSDGNHRDLYRYDAGGESLERISIAGPGGSDNGSFDISVNSNRVAPGANFAEEGRWVSEDAEAIAFSTAEPLLLGDDDGEPNPYIWIKGELARIAAAVEEPPTLSTDGTEFGFATRKALLPQDSDTASDAYVARQGGGFPNPPEPLPPCEGEACQGPPAPRPDSLAPESEGTSAGNVKPCKKGFVRKGTKCVKKPKKKKNRAGHHRASKTGSRGGSK